MAEKTAISWTTHSFNIAWGCHEVSPGCDACYARTLAERWGYNVWGPPASTPRRLFDRAHWDAPRKWNREAEAEGRRHRVFCSSMADVFEAHPSIDYERENKLWPLIRETPWLDWQLLTKRPERILRRLPADWGDGYPNVWLGTSVENQEWANRRIPALLRVPAAVRFLSAEPLLGPIDLAFAFWHGVHPGERKWRTTPSPVQWVIIGGESGATRRECEVEWIASIVEQCRAAGVTPFVKQDSGRLPGKQGRIPLPLYVQEMPQVAAGGGG